MQKRVLAVLASGCLWGFMGVFRRMMGDMGVSTAGVIILRCAPSALAFAIVLALKDPALLKIKLKDAWCFIGTGVFSLFLFSCCYFQAMNYMSLSAAAILLYTAPAMVTVLSAIIFKEKLTPLKLLALLLALLGCALVSGLGSGGLAFSTLGLIFGLGSGIGYALYSIFAACALRRGYNSNTVNFYSCLLTALCAAVVWGPTEPFVIMFASWRNAIICLGAALVTCFIPYMLYTYGLAGLEAGRASIMASVEPVVATLCGVAFYNERLTLLSVLGIVLVLGAVVLLNLPAKSAAVENMEKSSAGS